MYDHLTLAAIEACCASIRERLPLTQEHHDRLEAAHAVVLQLERDIAGKDIQIVDRRKSATHELSTAPGAPFRIITDMLSLAAMILEEGEVRVELPTFARLFHWRGTPEADLEAFCREHDFVIVQHRDAVTFYRRGNAPGEVQTMTVQSEPVGGYFTFSGGPYAHVKIWVKAGDAAVGDWTTYGALKKAHATFLPDRERPEKMSAQLPSGARFQSRDGAMLDTVPNPQALLLLDEQSTFYVRTE